MQNIRKEIEEIEIPYDILPKNKDYLLDLVTYKYTAKGYKQKEETINAFKKRSEFRIYMENIIEKYDLKDLGYELVYVPNDEWYHSFTIIKIQ